MKKLFLCFVSKPRVGPINSKHFTFNWGNFFAAICTLVLSLWFNHTKSYLYMGMILYLSITGMNQLKIMKNRSISNFILHNNITYHGIFYAFPNSPMKKLVKLTSFKNLHKSALPLGLMYLFKICSLAFFLPLPTPYCH